MTQSFHQYNGSAAGHVLVTGTSSGIGRASALYLADRGFTVWAGVRTAKEAVDWLATGCEKRHLIRPIQLDVTDGESIRTACQQVRAGVGKQGLCGLVNNAGVCVVGPVEFISPQAWREQMEVNLIGVIDVTQTMLPLLRIHQAIPGGRAARIVNMGSITGEISTPMFGAYSASKFALRAMNDALRLELQPQGMHVCLVVPGTIQSEIWQKEKACVSALRANPPARQIYGPMIDSVANYVFSCAEKALPAQSVALAVHRCLTEKKPRIEYRVGWEAHVGSRAKKWIPMRIFDLLLANKMGVPKSLPGGGSVVDVINPMG